MISPVAVRLVGMLIAYLKNVVPASREPSYSCQMNQTICIAPKTHPKAGPTIRVAYSPNPFSIGKNVAVSPRRSWQRRLSCTDIRSAFRIRLFKFGPRLGGGVPRNLAQRPWQTEAAAYLFLSRIKLLDVVGTIQVPDYHLLVNADLR